MEWMDFPQFSVEVERQMRRWVAGRRGPSPYLEDELVQLLRRFLATNPSLHPTRAELEAVLERCAKAGLEREVRPGQ